MNERFALRLAIQALESQCKDMAFEANLGDRYGANAFPEARKAAARRRKYREAIQYLKGKLHETA